MNIPDFIAYFFLALGYSFFGSMPPATGNLLTIQLSITRGFKAALIFALGEVLVEFVYGYIAWLISDFISEKANYDFHLKIIAIPIFLIMAIYFFINKKPVEKETEIKLNRNFTYGLMIGLLNPLAIPFWVVNISYFFSNGWVIKDSRHFWFFIAGIPVGSFLLLFIYALLGKKIYTLLKFRIEILNRSIAIIFILLAAIQTILLLND